MHFGKTYSQLLLTLPPELQENAIEYRQLKKLIHKVVNELASLGLNPSVLHTLLESNSANFSGSENAKGKKRAADEGPGDLLKSETSDDASRSHQPSVTKAVYEVVQEGQHIHPRLRIQVAAVSDDADAAIGSNEAAQSSAAQAQIKFLFNASSESLSSFSEDPGAIIRRDYEPPDSSERDLLLDARPIVARPGQSLIWTLQKNLRYIEEEKGTEVPPDAIEEHTDAVTKYVAHPTELVQRQMRICADGTREVIISLQSDIAFFELLYSALQTLSSHLRTVRSNFIRDLESLASTISHTALPQSALPGSFHPLSSTSDPRDISAPLISPFSSAFIPGGKAKSDLYTWREIFQLYVEAEIFESVHELDRGERNIAEAERRLALFAEQVTLRGLNDKRKLAFKESRNALETFLQLNVLILNLKKFQFANAEAARKILKKHAKRTALPFPIPRLSDSSATLELDSQVFSALRTHHPEVSQTSILTLIPTSTTSLPHLFVQAIGETLLPVVPHLDDFACLICGDIAFKPIRLNCRHLFCVRCLVKMQKRGQDHCPCCRAPTVLMADRSNVDWAMLNFMRDWFPRETTKKLKQNEKEAAQEQMEELGITDHPCIVV